LTHIAVCPGAAAPGILTRQFELRPPFADQSSGTRPISSTSVLGGAGHRQDFSPNGIRLRNGTALWGDWSPKGRRARTLGFFQPASPPPGQSPGNPVQPGKTLPLIGGQSQGGKIAVSVQRSALSSLCPKPGRIRLDTAQTSGSPSLRISHHLAAPSAAAPIWVRCCPLTGYLHRQPPLSSPAITGRPPRRTARRPVTATGRILHPIRPVAPLCDRLAPGVPPHAVLGIDRVLL
jgi:hypothetical protein